MDIPHTLIPVHVSHASSIVDCDQLQFVKFVLRAGKLASAFQHHGFYLLQFHRRTIPRQISVFPFQVRGFLYWSVASGTPFGPSEVGALL